MERVPIWAALLLSLLAITQGLLSQRRFLSERLRAMLPAILLSAVGLVVLALLTLPTQPPWSPGQSLWLGLLLGGVTVGLGALFSPEPDADARSAAFGAALQAGVVSLGVTLLVLAYQGRVLDPFAGFAVGALFVGVLLSAGSILGTSGNLPARAVVLGAETTTLAAVALASTTYLAAFHRSPLGVREWLPLPVLLVAVLAIALAARGMICRADDRGLPMTLAVVVVPLVVVLWLIAYPLQGTAGFLIAFLVGGILYRLSAWLAGKADRTTSEQIGQPGDSGVLHALLLLGAALIAFRMLHGYGLGLVVLGALAAFWLVGIERPAAVPDRPLLRWGLVLSLSLVLYRCYIERNQYTRGFQPDFFYYYVALVLGALLPGILSGVASIGAQAMPASDRVTWGSVLRVGTAALVAVLFPLAVWVLMGDRAQAALLLGITVAAAFGLRDVGATAATTEDRYGALQRLGAIAVMVTAWPVPYLLQPLAMQTRLQRVGLLVAIGVVIIVGLFLSAWLDRRRSAAEVAEG